MTAGTTFALGRRSSKIFMLKLDIPIDLTFPVSSRLSIACHVSIYVGLWPGGMDLPSMVKESARDTQLNSRITTFVPSHGPVHKVEINIVHVQPGEAALKSLRYTPMVVIPSSLFSTIAICKARPTHASLVVKNISDRGIPDSFRALPTCSSLP